jgi:hypothetical protein
MTNGASLGVLVIGLIVSSFVIRHSSFLKSGEGNLPSQNPPFPS